MQLPKIELDPRLAALFKLGSENPRVLLLVLAPLLLGALVYLIGLVVGPKIPSIQDAVEIGELEAEDNIEVRSISLPFRCPDTSFVLLVQFCT